jgi:hypothetical protein
MDAGMRCFSEAAPVRRVGTSTIGVHWVMSSSLGRINPRRGGCQWGTTVHERVLTCIQTVSHGFKIVTPMSWLVRNVSGDQDQIVFQCRCSQKGINDRFGLAVGFEPSSEIAPAFRDGEGDG